MVYGLHSSVFLCSLGGVLTVFQGFPIFTEWTLCKGRWKRCPYMSQLQSQTSSSMNFITFSFPFFLSNILKCLGEGCSNCLHYLKYQQSISTAYQQESRAVFYKRLQGKHLRPMARLEFEILTLVYDGTWCSS